MSRIEARLEELGLELPAPMQPVGSYQPVKVFEGIGFIAGHGPFDGDKLLVEGTVGGDLSLEEGREAAKLVALAIMASLKQELGDLDRVAAVAAGGRIRPLGARLPRQREGRERLQRDDRRDLGRRGTTCALRAGAGPVPAQRPGDRGRDRCRLVACRSASAF
jgi:YjgF/chorismate_mutase-like, putative endoribonuclease